MANWWEKSLFYISRRNKGQQEVLSLQQAANHIHGLSDDAAVDCALSFLNLRVCVEL